MYWCGLYNNLKICYVKMVGRYQQKYILPTPFYYCYYCISFPPSLQGRRKETRKTKCTWNIVMQAWVRHNYGDPQELPQGYKILQKAHDTPIKIPKRWWGEYKDQWHREHRESECTEDVTENSSSINKRKIIFFHSRKAGEKSGSGETNWPNTHQSIVWVVNTGGPSRPPMPSLNCVIINVPVKYHGNQVLKNWVKQQYT